MSRSPARRARQRARRRERRSHTGKRSYATLEEAEVVAAVVSAKTGTIQQAYECEHGDVTHFHTGGIHHPPVPRC